MSKATRPSFRAAANSPTTLQRRSVHEELRQPGRLDHRHRGHRLPDLRARRPREALMSQNVIAVIVLVVLLAISTPLLGSYMAKVFQNKKAPGDRIFGPIERLVYKVTGVNPESEQRWTTYAISVPVSYTH